METNMVYETILKVYNENVNKNKNKKSHRGPYLL